ncbi:hypothetical protein F5Y15DRAFT_338218 [Xylariaceae sp. FL0016]|nr:hypothetical protein F5Y15DRAFT_338218 [Xylariaceae sp. FL0016]
MPVAPGTWWELLERNHVPPKRRSPHTKARTGCTTCKGRRVKCDERKPLCARCEKSGYKCRGYDDPKPRRNAALVSIASRGRTAELAILQPKPRHATSVIAMESCTLNSVRPSLVPEWVAPRDILYFDRFRTQVIEDIAVWCGAQQWRQMMQFVTYDKCLQHAAMAVAAMALGMEQSPEPTQSMLPSPHKRAAFYHYTRAIALCRERIIGGLTAETAPASFTVTFFFAIIEMLQGNVGEADEILANGLLLMDESFESMDGEAGPSIAKSSQLSGIKLAFDRMNITWGLCPFFQNQKKDQLRLHPAEEFDISCIDSSLYKKQIFWNRFQREVGAFMMSVRCGKIISPEQMPALLVQRSAHLKQLEQWMVFLEAALEKDKESRLLITMKAYALTCKIFLNCFPDRSDLSYDHHVEDFREVVGLCKMIIPKQPHTYLRVTLDVDLFPIISFTVTKCRDAATRQLALRVFAQLTHRQAMWNNDGLFKALRVLVDLEHKGRDGTGFIPPSSRYYFVGSEWEFERRRMVAMFVGVTSVPTASGDLPTVRVPIEF